MEKFIQQKLDFPNFLSKVLLKDSWLRQFHIPIPNPWLAEWALKFLEEQILKPDITEIYITKPIFIIGPPRSGTTMLQDVICNHERIAYMMNIQNGFDKSVYAAAWLRERLNLNVGGERYLQDSIYADTTTSAEPSVHWGKWTKRDVHDLIWEERRFNFFDEETLENIYQTIKKIILWWSHQKEQPRFFCKYPAFTTEVRTLRDLFPDAKFIHIIRDGRQVANSLIKLYELSKQQLVLAKHPTVKELIPYPRIKNLKSYIDQWGPSSLETTTRVWMDCLDLVESFKNNRNDIYDVRYEDILKNPIEEMNKIWKFCELPKPSVDNKKYWEKFEQIGKIHHSNSYSGEKLIETIAETHLKKYGYL